MYPTRPAAVDGQRFLGARARAPPPPSLSTPFHRGHARRPIAAPGHSPFAEFFAPSRPTPLTADGVAATASAAAPEQAAAVDSRSSGLLVDDQCTDTTLIASRVSDPNQTALLSLLILDGYVYVYHNNYYQYYITVAVQYAAANTIYASAWL